MTGQNEEQEATVQDDYREELLCKLLGLRHMPGRWGHDAEDEFQHPFELKSTSKDSIGTARDVSPQMIAEWRERFWICATGNSRKKPSGEKTFEVNEVYFLHPDMLQGWFGKLEARFDPDMAIKDVALQAAAAMLSPEQLGRLSYLINRGATYNNPHISMKYIRENGISIDLTRAPAHLRELVAAHPLKSRAQSRSPAGASNDVNSPGTGRVSPAQKRILGRKREPQ